MRKKSYSLGDQLIRAAIYSRILDVVIQTWESALTVHRSLDYHLSMDIMTRTWCAHVISSNSADFRKTYRGSRYLRLKYRRCRPRERRNPVVVELVLPEIPSAGHVDLEHVFATL